MTGRDRTGDRVHLPADVVETTGAHRLDVGNEVGEITTNVCLPHELLEEQSISRAVCCAVAVLRDAAGILSV